MEDTTKSEEPMSRSEDNTYVGLTQDMLDPLRVMNMVKSPKAGAVVLFAGMGVPPSPQFLRLSWPRITIHIDPMINIPLIHPNR